MSAWAEPGRPGWFPDAWNASEAPWSLAGLGVGGLWLDEPGGATAMLPAPGILAARRALVWSDTLAASLLDDAAWRGFGAALVRLRGTAAPPGAGGAFTTFQAINGTNAYDGNALAVERGDSLSGLRVEMQTTTSGATGPFQRGSRHLWGLSARGARGAHQWQAAYTQRGTGQQLADGDEENAAGESGALAYRVQSRSGWGRLSLERGSTHQESSGLGLPLSRRDAQENRAALEVGRGAGATQLALRVEWRGARAARVTDLQGVFERRVQQLWSAARFERALGAGRLEASFGAGRDGGSERWTLAPTGATSFGSGTRRVRLSLGRLLQPVWSDLAPGERPFLQSTWAAGAELGAGGPRARVRTAVLAGRTADRALVSRMPLADLWMREGLRRDALRYRFALASASGSARLGALDLGGEGYLLGRDRDGGEPQVDPNWGARASAGWRLSAFQHDLGVALRAEAEWVGERETEEIAPRRLAAVTSFGAAAVFTLADAALTLRARNLEDRPREQSWIDPITGRPAVGPGLELRGTFTWRLLN